MTHQVYVGGHKVSHDGVQYMGNLVWDEDQLMWVPLTVGTPDGVAANVYVNNWPDVQVVSLTPGRSLTPASPDSAEVEILSSQILPANAARMGLVLLNLSGNTISIGLGEPAVLNHGITLTPYGSYVMDANTMYNGAIHACASVDDSVLSIQEFSE